MNDGSKRQKLDHGVGGLTFVDTQKCSVEAIILSDSVTAGKKGDSQAQQLYNSLPEGARSKLKAMVYDTTSSNTGSKSGMRAELQRKLRSKIMEMRCFQHVWSLVMVAFGIRLNGATPSLHTGTSTRPQPIAYLFFHAYVENRDSKEVKEAYELLWGKNFGTRQEPIWTRWKYVLTASIQARSRWPWANALCLLKSTQVEGGTGYEVPPEQPIARLKQHDGTTKIICAQDVEMQCHPASDTTARDDGYLMVGPITKKSKHVDVTPVSREYASVVQSMLDLTGLDSLSPEAEEKASELAQPLGGDWHTEAAPPEDEAERLVEAFFVNPDPDGGAVANLEPTYRAPFDSTVGKHTTT